MGARAGTADLPLHGGFVPEWLASRMSRMGRIVTEAIILHYGRDAFLERLSHPFWFQSLGCVLGMDWHSSGITTSVLGALKRGINPRAHELGLYVCGGRGRHSPQTPNELQNYSMGTRLDGDSLARISGRRERVDKNAFAEGFNFSLQGLVVSSGGDWTIVQRGMKGVGALARRYHWHSATVRDFTVQPHSAIVGDNQGTIMN